MRHLNHESLTGELPCGRRTLHQKSNDGNVTECGLFVLKTREKLFHQCVHCTMIDQQLRFTEHLKPRIEPSMMRAFLFFPLTSHTTLSGFFSSFSIISCSYSAHSIIALVPFQSQISFKHVKNVTFTYESLPLTGLFHHHAHHLFERILNRCSKVPSLLSIVRADDFNDQLRWCLFQKVSNQRLFFIVARYSKYAGAVCHLVERLVDESDTRAVRLGK